MRVGYRMRSIVRCLLVADRLTVKQLVRVSGVTGSSVHDALRRLEKHALVKKKRAKKVPGKKGNAVPYEYSLVSVQKALEIL